MEQKMAWLWNHFYQAFRRHQLHGWGANNRLFIILTVVFCVLGSAQAQPSSEPSLFLESPEGGALNTRFSGYNKTYFIRSKTFERVPESYDLGLNRTRLKWSGQYPSGLGLYVENDTEWRFGNYLSTAQSLAQRTQPNGLYWDLGSTWTDDSRQRLTNDFFRAYAKLSLADTDVSVGRQRIVIGSGRLWSTLDMLNPVNPLQVERDELVGVDAVLWEQGLGPLSKFSAVYAPQPGGGPARWVLRYRTHIGQADVSTTVARYWGENLAGLDVATQWGGLGVRGELTATNPALGASYTNAVLGLDYAFENTLTLTLEGYASSQPQTLRMQQLTLQPRRAQVQPLGTRYLGMVGSYEFNPLIKATVVVLTNLRDDSRFASASVAWTARENLVLELGTQRFSGKLDSEYGRGQPLIWLRGQWFF
jgi:hypothetical protein